MIDFEIDQEMIGLNTNDKNKKKQDEAASANVVKANLNESSDFDLDNY